MTDTTNTRVDTGSRIGTQEAVAALKAAGYRCEQMEKGTLLAYKGKVCYGFAWRSTGGGKGYNLEAITTLAKAVNPVS